MAAGTNRKHGRNKAKCERYRRERRREKSVLAHAERVLRLMLRKEARRGGIYTHAVEVASTAVTKASLAVIRVH